MDLPPEGVPKGVRQAAGGELARRIAGRIQDAGGWIGFDAFMAMALYAPGLGYYAGGAAKFGPAGDFVTAPGLSPLFARCIAAQLSQWFADHPDLPRRVVEFGAGDGALAGELIVALEAAGTPVGEYVIVELSGELRARQHATISRRLEAAGAHGKDGASSPDAVRWWDALPERIEGCVIGNELLDAMPVRLFRVAAGKVLERGVSLVEGGADADALADAEAEADAKADAKAGAPRARFAFSDRAADGPFAAQVDAALQAGFADAVPDWRSHAAQPAFDYVSELPEQGPAWVREVGARLSRGALLLLDYGFPRAEFYHPQRRGGTLMAHRRHRAHGDVLHAPGTQDITAHVDFSAIASAGEATGLTLAGYTSQAHFLMNCGMLDAFAREQSEATSAVDKVRQAQAVQVLLSEAEMGELFKAIAFVRGIDAASVGFTRGDRSHRL